MPDFVVKDQAAQTDSVQTQGDTSMSNAPQTSPTLPPITSYTLKNGLQVFLIEKKAIPMATVLIAVRNGSFIETNDNNGLAHLYEHMFFKANEKIPSQPEFIRSLDEMGVELGPNMNAYTSTESVRYFFTIQSQYIKRGIGFMADALISPKFLQEELERERKVVIGEFDRYEASPTEVFFQKNFMERMFRDNFVRKNVIGQRPVILSASQAQMKEIQHRYYIPNNSALFIVGEFNESEVRDDIEKNFGVWKSGPNPLEQFPVPEHPALQKSESFTEEGPVQTVHLALGFHGPKLTFDDQDLVALDIMSSILGFQSSPLQKELVHTNIASSAGFWAWSQRYTSPLVFSIEADPATAQKAYDTLFNLVARIRQGGFFNDADLKTAQTSIEVSSAYDRESGQKYALTLASIWSSTGDLKFYHDYVTAVKKVTLADLDRCAKKYFSQPYILGALMPKGSKPIVFAKEN